MKKGKYINVVLVLAAVALLVVCAFAVRIDPAADKVAVLATTGMTCGGCKAAVEKALRTKTGVAAVEVDVKRGRVVVAYDSKKTVPDLLASVVTGAGYGSRVSEVLGIGQFRAITGRNIGQKAASSGGCGGT